MNWLPLSRYAPKKTLVNRGFLVASILLLGSGCRVPLLNPTALASVTAPIQQVNKPHAEPASFVKQVSLETPAEATEARLSKIDAGDRSTSQVDQSGFSHSPGDNKIWNYDPKVQGGAELNLAAPESWKFDRPSDAQTDLGDFSGLLEQDRPTSLIGRMWDDQKNFYSAESLTLLGEA